METNCIEIDGLLVMAKSSEHESGHAMIAFRPFLPKEISVEKFAALIETAAAKCGREARFCRIRLERTQTEELDTLKSMGFAIDGYEYKLDLDRVSELVGRTNIKLPSSFSIEEMSFDRDIDDVVALEKQVHAEDQSSRVNFDTQQAIDSMRRYYERATSGVGVFILRCGKTIVGVLGFMPDNEHSKTIHISSVSIALAHQGKGLFFPFLLGGLAHLDRESFKALTGVTTTEKLRKLASKHCLEPVSYSLIREL